MAKHPLTPALARGCWGAGETAILIKAWAPLYQRRRAGKGDPWVPPHVLGRARSSRGLVTEDWRAVAAEVNKYRAAAAAAGARSFRTHEQCKLRVRTLKRIYKKERAAPSGWRFFHDLDAVWAGEVRDCGAATDEGRAAAAGETNLGATVEAHGGVAAGEADLGPAVEARGGAVVVEGGSAAGDARGGVAVDEGFAAAATDVLGGRIPKRPRTGCGGVKEELVQQARARAVAADDDGRRDAPGNAASAEDGRGASAGDASGGGAAVVGLAAAVADVLRGALGGTLGAGGTTDAAVVTMLGDVYKQLTLKRLDVEREKAAAAAARGGAGAGRRRR